MQQKQKIQQKFGKRTVRYPVVLLTINIKDTAKTIRILKFSSDPYIFNIFMAITLYTNKRCQYVYKLRTYHINKTIHVLFVSSVLLIVSLTPHAFL